MKIGFCFLLYKGVTQQKAWHSFFKNTKKEDFGIYFHSKEPKKANKQKLLKGKGVPFQIKTSWADVSLVEASIELFRAALKDNCDYMFLVSDKCVPIHTFSFIKSNISDNCSIIHYGMNNSLSGTQKGYFDNNETSRRYEESKSIKHYIKKKDFIKADQWVGLNREHAKLIVEDSHLIEHFDDVFAADEHFVSTILNQKGKLLDCKNKKTTFTDWTSKKEWRHPKTYFKVSFSELGLAKSSGAFFLRKIPWISNFNIINKLYGKCTFRLPRGKKYIAFVHIPKNGGCSIKKYLKNDGRFLKHHHHTAKEIKKELGEDLWRETFVFTTVRNPWSRVVSAFTFLQAGGLPQFQDKIKAIELGIKKDTDINEWIKENKENFLKSEPFEGTAGWMHFKKQTSYINEDIDKIIKLEDEEQKRKLFKKTIPVENKSTKKDSRPKLNKESKKIISKAYSQDIKVFGYRFHD